MSLWYSLFGSPQNREEFVDALQRSNQREVSISLYQKACFGIPVSYEVVSQACSPQGPNYIIERKTFYLHEMSFAQQRLLEVILLKVCAFEKAVGFGRYLEQNGIRATVDGLSLDNALAIRERIENAPARSDPYLCSTIRELKDLFKWPG